IDRALRLLTRTFTKGVVRVGIQPREVAVSGVAVFERYVGHLVGPRWVQKLASAPLTIVQDQDSESRHVPDRGLPRVSEDLVGGALRPHRVAHAEGGE